MALSASVTATGDVTAGAASVLAVQVRATAAAGTVVLKDGGAGGTTKLTVYTPASAAATVVVPIPGGGILFASKVHATLTNADGLTVVYQ